MFKFFKAGESSPYNSLCQILRSSSANLPYNSHLHLPRSLLLPQLLDETVKGGSNDIFVGSEAGVAMDTVGEVIQPLFFVEFTTAE